MNKNTMVRVAVLWNDTVFSETLIKPNKGATLGTHKKADIRAPSQALLSTDLYDLFTKGGSMGAQLILNPNMKGWIEQNGERREIAGESSMQFLGLGDRGLVNITDNLAVFFYVIDTDKESFAVPLLASEGPHFLSTMAFALLIHFGVLIAAFMYKNYDLAAEMSFQGVDRFLSEVVQIEDTEPEELMDEDEDLSKQAGGEEGKFGEEDKIEESKVPKTEGEMVDKIKKVGVLQAVSQLSAAGALSSVLGNRTEFSDQLNAAAMGGADGELLMGHGAGGMGLRGTGGGGGGSGFGRIHGMGSVDTGGGRGTKSRLRRRGKAKKRFKVSRGRPTVGNYCKQADILRVVTSRQRSVQYCYEKELARNPELKGKVILNWRIGLSGKVMKAWVGSSSLKNGTVESCMTRAVKFWRFTKPDGGICEIKFPFVFSPGF